MMPRCTGQTLVLVSAIIAGGCGPDVNDAASAAGIRVDTIGGVVQVISGERGLWDESGEAWRVDAEGAVTVGEAEGPEAYVFARIAGAYVAEDGRVYVGDMQAREVRVFSPIGAFISRFGRAGEGPGEFGHISGVGRAPDGGVAVLDGQLGLVSVFDTEGVFRRAFRLERPYRIIMTGESVRFDSAGRFHDVTQLSRATAIDSLGVMRYSADGAVEDTIVIAVHEPPDVVVEQNGRPVMSFTLPYAPRPSGAVGPDGSVYASLGAEYRIVRFAPNGDTALVIQRTVPPARLTAAARDSARAALVERYRVATGTEPRDLPAIPEHAPAVAGLRVDDLGFLWVRRGAPGPGGSVAWDVFDTAGAFLGSLMVRAMNVMHIGERSITGVVYDELDVPTVVVLPLDRGPDTESSEP